MPLLKLDIENMNCSSCVAKIEKKLQNIEGVIHCSIHFASGKGRVEVKEIPFIEKKVIEALESIGYPAKLSDKNLKSSQKKFLIFSLKIRVFLAVILSFPLMIPMISLILGKQVELPVFIQVTLATLVQFGLGFSFYVGAWKSIKSLTGNMDLLVALGISAAYFFSLGVVLFNIPGYLYFETSALLITFILIGRWIEKHAKEKAQKGMKAILMLEPKVANLKRANQVIEIPVEEVKKGDIILIKPGKKIPVDGTVLSGRSHVDESMLSGESLPVQKKPQKLVFAGTFNGEGSLEVESKSTGKNTRLTHIIELVEKVQSSKAPVEKLVDRISSYFVPAVLGIAILTFLVWGWVGDFEKGMVHAIAVLVIACPCALGLATPTVIMVACARAVRIGVLIRDAEAFQQLNKVETLVVDKTGTITEGKLSVKAIYTTKKAFLQKAVSLAAHSSHPISQAICRYAKEKQIQPDQVISFSSHAGEGLSGNVEGKKYFLGSLSFLENQHVPIVALKEKLKKETHTICILADESQELGYMVFVDKIKESSFEAFEKFNEMGKEIYLMSGDRKEAVTAVAKQLGISHFFSEVLPEDKAKYVQKLKDKQKIVGMVGDGINDALAMATADVGIALAQGADVAMENASIGLMENHLTHLASAFLLSHLTLKKIWQNLFFAFFYNCIAIPLAFLGLLTPLVAGAAMAMSSISVILNALTLQKKSLNP